ncbi:MAG: ABC transporter ATP-binding protein [Candidatus Absconditabacterales bacterium]|nr:ABC transporter ATP-binding protein [Candidatus Absconditabacterales bacterium]
MITLSHVSKSFIVNEETLTLYRDLNRIINDGEFVCIMGPSGSGKSTLFNICAGLDTPTSGTVTIDGITISDLSPDQRAERRAQSVGFIFQQFRLVPHLTVEENIDLAVDLIGAPRRFATKDLLTMVGLGPKINSYPSDLSGGEQQRVGIARAVVANKKYLFADEPTASLDLKNAHRIMDLITDLHKKLGLTVLMITHDHAMARYAQTVYEIVDETIKQKHDN